MRAIDIMTGRRGFAMALILLVAVAGYARGLVATAAIAEPAGFTLCHGAAGDTRSGDAINHDCCDQCVAAVAAILPAPAVVSLPVEVAEDANLAAAVADVPGLVERWTPRQSRGPPLAGLVRFSASL